MQSAEMAKQSLEHAHALGGSGYGGTDSWTRRAAILAFSFAAPAVHERRRDRRPGLAWAALSLGSVV